MRVKELGPEAKESLKVNVIFFLPVCFSVSNQFKTRQ